MSSLDSKNRILYECARQKKSCFCIFLNSYNRQTFFLRAPFYSSRLIWYGTYHTLSLHRDRREERGEEEESVVSMIWF
jgi:hypothetical protein